MEKIRISAVKYANTYPFLYGLIKSGFDRKVTIETDHPADCADKLISGRADIGLVPVAALLQLNEYYLLSNYCIGANGKVRTVMLLSNSSRFENIDTAYLDYRSRSSVNLIKVLSAHMWKKKFRWINTTEKSDFVNIKKKEAVVLIGDQCFEYEKYFSLKIDLAEEWKIHTGLPFVFACWTSNRQLDKRFLDEFNEALKLGVDNIPDVAKKYGRAGRIKEPELLKYLVENIDYNFNEEKKSGMKLFLELLKRTNESII
jgi:chorismate dehydratase